MSATLEWLLQWGQRGVAPSAELGSASPLGASRAKYPRVDPPPIEDGPGEALRENTPGYIAQAFPKLFPHGTGDYHAVRANMGNLLSFGEWGRFVLMWHDGRFMRHTRFRYWLLDTVLRTKTPGIQRTFFRVRAAAADITLADLEGDKENLEKF